MTKTKPKHTPYPWLLDAECPGHVTNQSGDAIADCFLVYSNIDRRQCMANARLIAHAPELYWVLVSGLQNGLFKNFPLFAEQVETLLMEIDRP